MSSIQAKLNVDYIKNLECMEHLEDEYEDLKVTRDDHDEVILNELRKTLLQMLQQKENLKADRPGTPCEFKA
jgi:hypothetical protein